MNKKLLLIFLCVSTVLQGIFWLPNTQIESSAGQFSVDISGGTTNGPKATFIYPGPGSATTSTAGILARSISTEGNFESNTWDAAVNLITSSNANRFVASTYFGLDIKLAREDVSDLYGIAVWNERGLYRTRGTVFTVDSTNGLELYGADQTLLDGSAVAGDAGELASGQHVADIVFNTGDTDLQRAYVTQVFGSYNQQWLLNVADLSGGAPVWQSQQFVSTFQDKIVGTPALGTDDNDTTLMTTNLFKSGNIDVIGSILCDTNLVSPVTIIDLFESARSACRLAMQKSTASGRIGMVIDSGFNNSGHTTTYGLLRYSIFTNNGTATCGTWGKSFSTDGVNGSGGVLTESAIAMNGNGDAMIVWLTLNYSNSINNVGARYYNHTTKKFENIKTLYTGNNLKQSSITVSIDDVGNAVASWAYPASGSGTPDTIGTAVYVRNVDQWLEAQSIATGSFTKVMCAQNISGQAVIGWSDSSANERAATVNRFVGALPTVAMGTPTYNQVSPVTQPAPISSVTLAFDAVQLFNNLSMSVTPFVNQFATQAESVNQISWQGATGAQFYEIYRNVDCTNLNDATPIAITTETTYEDHNRPFGNSDTYCVVYVGSNDLNYCNELTWPAFPAVASYQVERNDGSGFVVIATLDGDQASYTDCDIQEGVTYSYQLIITPIGGYSINFLSWDPIDGACGYNVYRSTGAVPDCLLSTKTKLLSNGKQVFVDILPTGDAAGQDYVVTSGILSSNGVCCDKCNVVTWGVGGLDTNYYNGGFNIYKDGKFLTNVSSVTGAYEDCIDAAMQHTYIVVGVDTSGIETYPLTGVISASACASSLSCCIVGSPLCP